LKQREIVIWRGLRAATQEGHLYQLYKTKDGKETAYVLGDLEKLQAKIQAQAKVEAAVAAATSSAPKQSSPPARLSTSTSTTSAANLPPTLSTVKPEEDSTISIAMDLDVAPATNGVMKTEALETS
jgi:hypothetical protein